jgi:hypothetical protein
MIMSVRTVKVIEIDHGWKRIQKEMKKLNKSYTAIGFFGHGGKPSNDMAARAAVNELGAKIRVTQKMRWFFLFKFGKMLMKRILYIPKRPFMKQTYEKNKNKINKKCDQEYMNIVKGKSSVKQALSRLGEWYTGHVKVTIRKGNFKANAPLTIQQKNSSKPLMDTGQMWNSVRHREFIK